MLSVSERTNYRRMERYGLRALNFINISDDELDQHVTEAAKHFRFCGEQMLKFLLKARGIKVQRIRLGIVYTVWTRKEWKRERNDA